MKKTAVVYWSGTGNTESMANAVLEGMKAAGAEAALLTSAEADSAKLAEFDAEKKFAVEYGEGRPSPCRCGDVICGRIAPQECPMFGAHCTPEDPVGPCMVSSEGACAAAYKYQSI